MRMTAANPHTDMRQRLIGHYTTIDHESDIMLGAIKIDLNRHLGTFVGEVIEEVAHNFETQLPPCDGMFIRAMFSGRKR